jgi:hypothetical protein
MAASAGPGRADAPPASADLYGARICVAADAPEGLRGAAGELALWLRKATGAEFTTVLPPAESGVVLALADSPLAPAQGLEELKAREGAEAFLIRSDGPRLWIVGKSPLGVRNGVYFYLEQLGFRWFMPMENWSIVPALKSLRIDIHRVEAPAFRMRGAFGTGGFGGKLPVDPKMEKQEQWAAWARRIRFSGEFSLGGHAGEAFNRAHMKELKAHPEYLAELGGKREPWGQGTKPCYSNPGLIELYVKDRVDALRRAVTQSPDAPRSFAVSVEPADGGGHCDCAECRKVGSVSDRVFSLANAVAKAVAKELPGRRVSLLAYNEHAAVPRIALEPNLYVMVVPYAFQRTGLAPEELLTAWTKKVSPFAVYDYWAIPDWAFGQPTAAVPQVAAKIRLWHRLGANGACIESDSGGGSVGIVQYVASRLLWDPATDEKAVLDDFYAKAFAGARAPMERMLGRWTQRFNLAEDELGASYRDIQEARALAKDPAVAARVNDYALYLHFLRLSFEYRLTPAKSEAHKKLTNDLLAYLWRIYPCGMTHSYRLAQLILNRPAGGVEHMDLKDDWDVRDKKAGAWKEFTVPSAAEVDALMADGLRAYPAMEGVEPRTFSPALVALTPQPLNNDTVRTPRFSGTHNFEFLAPPGVRSLTLGIQTGVHGPALRVTVFDRNGAEVFQKEVPISSELQDLQIDLPASGYYRMTVFDQKRMFSLQLPARLPFVVTGRFNAMVQSPTMYFFVPAGTKRVALNCESATPVDVLDGSNRRLPVTGRRLLCVDVPPGQDGAMWSLRNIKTSQPVRLVNVPPVWSFSPQGLMVPEDVAPKVAR